jgi:hypothetical protein
MQGYLGPPIVVGQPRKPIFDNLTPLYVYCTLSVKKSWDHEVAPCQWAIIHGHTSMAQFLEIINLKALGP